MPKKNKNLELTEYQHSALKELSFLDTEKYEEDAVLVVKVTKRLIYSHAPIDNAVFNRINRAGLTKVSSIASKYKRMRRSSLDASNHGGDINPAMQLALTEALGK